MQALTTIRWSHVVTAASPKRTCAPEGGDEGLLDAVSGGFAVYERANRHRPHSVLVAPKQLPEGVRITLAVTPKQTGVVLGREA